MNEHSQQRGNLKNEVYTTKKHPVMSAEADFIWFGNIFYTFHALKFLPDSIR
ncbi:hypothetical protein [Xenorhabdus stockiae]|uniref:hypothetical protein n=1 Tax=Xenorhabdus stockiae TaxID=351614 RepID=UPI003CEB592A